MILSRIVSLLFLFCGLASPAPTTELLVVVHAQNPVGALPFEEIKNLLLQRQNIWINGEAIDYYLPPRSSKTFRYLLHGLLHLDDSDWDTYWERATARGKLPPKIVSDELIVLRRVTKDLNALGVIGSEFLKGRIRDEIKIIFRSEIP